MKKLLLSVFFIALSFAQNAQRRPAGNEGESFKRKLPDFIPSSPTSFELGKYGDIPVNEATGIANINIPLLTFKSNKISVPLSMNYQTSGVKVNQVSSWVGNGWSLNAGGTITRAIRGIPDEEAQSRSFPSFSSLINLKYGTQSQKRQFYSIINDIVNKEATDYAPDIFNFNIQGVSGSFYIDANMNTVVIKKESEVKIKIINNSILNGFKVETIDGTSYFFEANEKTKTRESCGSSGNPNPTGFKITSWLLTKIINFTGDEIYFEYNTNSYYNYVASISEVYSENIGRNHPREVSMPPEGVTKCGYTSFVDGKILTKIYSNQNNGYITFNSTKNRSDVNDYRLNSIQQYDNFNNLIKGYDFDYSNILSNKPFYGGNSFPLVGRIEQKYRLFLNFIIEKDKTNNSSNGKKYIFEYETPSDLPPRLSLSQDYLGFYNEKIN
jgi:hypothetical protein